MRAVSMIFFFVEDEITRSLHWRNVTPATTISRAFCARLVLLIKCRKQNHNNRSYSVINVELAPKFPNAVFVFSSVMTNMRAMSAKQKTEWNETHTHTKKKRIARKMSVVNFIQYLRGRDRIAFSGRVFFSRAPVVNAQNAFQCARVQRMACGCTRCIFQFEML